MSPLSIHVLKHAQVADAEEVFCEIARSRGHTARVVDPCATVFKLTPDAAPDVVVGRSELDSFSDPALCAYMAYFDACAAAGSAVVNSLEFLLVCQDKFRTHTAVRRHLRSLGVEDTINPDTALCFHSRQATEVAARFLQRHGSVILKKPHSGRGDGVFGAASPHAVESILRSEFPSGEPVLLQQPIDKETNERGGFKDFRVLAYRDAPTGQVEIAAAYYRNGEPGELKTNGSRGGGISSAGPTDPELLRWTRHVMDALRGDVAGLDFARDKQGRYWFLEVNFAFETLRRSSLTMFGNTIWEKAVDLAEARAAARPR
ncbi:MAG: hypothetical protein R3B70_32965 [Polyangiaceae bacterium]